MPNHRGVWNEPLINFPHEVKSHVLCLIQPSEELATCKETFLGVLGCIWQSTIDCKVYRTRFRVVCSTWRVLLWTQSMNSICPTQFPQRGTRGRYVWQWKNDVTKDGGQRTERVPHSVLKMTQGMWLQCFFWDRIREFQMTLSHTIRLPLICPEYRRKTRA